MCHKLGLKKIKTLFKCDKRSDVFSIDKQNTTYKDRIYHEFATLRFYRKFGRRHNKHYMDKLANYCYQVGG